MSQNNNLQHERSWGCENSSQNNVPVILLVTSLLKLQMLLLVTSLTGYSSVAADENINNVANNEDNHDVVGAHVGNVADIAEVAAVENIGNQVNQDDNHDVMNSPVIGSVPDIADINHGLLDGAAVETITGVQEHEYEQAPDITHFNRLLQSISQQLRLKDDKINELEARINHLQDWQNRVLSTNIQVGLRVLQLVAMIFLKI